MPIVHPRALDDLVILFFADFPAAFVRFVDNKCLDSPDFAAV